MNQHVSDSIALLRAFVANPRQVGAVLPTSRWAVRDMLDLGDVPNAKLVVELGAGTGVQTGELLDRLGPEAELVAVEIDPKLAELLAGKYRDPRLHVVCDSAENLGEHLDGLAIGAARDVERLGKGDLALEPVARRIFPGDDGSAELVGDRAAKAPPGVAPGSLPGNNLLFPVNRSVSPFGARHSNPLPIPLPAGLPRWNERLPIALPSNMSD